MNLASTGREKKACYHFSPYSDLVSDMSDLDDYPIPASRWRESKYAGKPPGANGPFQIATLRQGQIYDQAVGPYKTWEEAVQAIVDQPHMRPLPGRREAMAVIGADGEQFPLDFIKGMVAKNYDD